MTFKTTQDLRLSPAQFSNLQHCLSVHPLNSDMAVRKFLESIGKDPLNFEHIETHIVVDWRWDQTAR